MEGVNQENMEVFRCWKSSIDVLRVFWESGGTEPWNTKNGLYSL